MLFSSCAWKPVCPSYSASTPQTCEASSLQTRLRLTACLYSSLSCQCFPCVPIISICLYQGLWGGEKKIQTHWVALRFLSRSNEAFDAPRFNKEPFPNGSPVTVRTNEKSPSSRFTFPKCTTKAAGRAGGSSSPRPDSHVYAFVPHYSASASTDPHLAFKSPTPPPQTHWVVMPR